MVKKWTEIAESPDFAQLPDDEKDIVRESYFENVVAPEVSTEALEPTREAFYRASGYRSRALPAGTAPSTAGAGRGSVAPPAVDPRSFQNPGARRGTMRTVDPYQAQGEDTQFQRGSVLSDPNVARAMPPEGWGQPDQPLTDADLQRNVELSRSPVGKAQDDYIARARGAGAPELLDSSTFVAPTGGVGQAVKGAVPSAVAAVFESGARANKVLGDYGISLVPGYSPEEVAGVSKGQMQMLGRKTRAFSQGLDDKALVDLGPLITTVVPSARSLGEGLSEVGKQVVLNVVLPGGIIADAGVQGVNEAQMAGMNPGAALLVGVLKAGTEGVPEHFSAKFNLKAGADISLGGMLSDPKIMLEAAKRFGAGMGVELTTEQASAVGNWAVDKLARDPTATLDRLGTDMTDAIKATLVQAPGMMAAGKIAASAESLGRKISSFDLAAARGFNVKPPLTTDAPDAQVGKRFAAFKAAAAQYGMPDEAVKRAQAAIDGMPAEKVGPFLAALTKAYEKNGITAKPVDPVITELLAEPPLEPAKEIHDGLSEDPTATRSESDQETPVSAPAVQTALPDERDARELGGLAMATPASRQEEDYTGLAEVAPVDRAAHAAATSPTNDLPEPTEAQRDAGNYPKGHHRVGGLDISIENPQGSVRRSKADSPKKWETKMRHHYGYIRGTVGMDGDQIDTFVNPGTPDEFDGEVFVIDQKNPETGKPDEHKVMIGFGSIAEAKAAYLANYQKDWKGVHRITSVPMAKFKTWLKEGDTTRYFGDRGSKQPDVQPSADVAPATPASGGDQLAGSGGAVGPVAAGPAPAPAQPAPAPVARGKPPVAVPNAGARAPAVTKRRGKVGDKFAAGEIAITASGRETQPFPRVDTSTERKTQETLRRVDRWLISEALAEAQTRGDTFNERQFQAINNLNPSPADKDAAEEYLFGEQPKVIPSILKPLSPPPAPSPAKARVIAKVGTTPRQTEQLELRPNADGTVTPFLGRSEVLDFTTAEPVKLPADVTDAQAIDAVKKSGSLGRRQKFYSAETAPEGDEDAAQEITEQAGAGGERQAGDGEREAARPVVGDRVQRPEGSGEATGQETPAAPEAGVLTPADQAKEEARVFAEDYAALAGRVVAQQVLVAETGQTATLRMDAAQAMRALEQRRRVIEELRNCLTRSA